MAILVVGIIGYSVIKGYSIVDSVYMTVITMSTVGFETIGELIRGEKITSEDRLFIIGTDAQLEAFRKAYLDF